jgi:carbonic anhydrase/acetyltransferase-like protein (isoleucine patch superfamily)
MSENKKYKLTKNTKVVAGVTLFQIIALQSFNDIEKGDLGGWIEKESNLSVSGNAWVFGNASVFGNAMVSGDARVSGNAMVSGDARVSGNASVFGNAMVSGDASVFGNAMVSGDASVSGNAWVFGNASVFGNAWVFGNANCEKFITIHYRSVYDVTITDAHIQIGCEQKTIQDWKDWLKSDEVIETPRDTDKFKAIEKSLQAAFLLIEAREIKY